MEEKQTALRLAITKAIDKIEFIDLPPKSTICLIVFKNGFHQVGFTATQDVDDYDTELGRYWAKEDAMNKMEPIFAFMQHEQKPAAGNFRISPQDKTYALQQIEFAIQKCNHIKIGIVEAIENSDSQDILIDTNKQLSDLANNFVSLYKIFNTLEDRPISKADLKTAIGLNNFNKFPVPVNDAILNQAKIVFKKQNVQPPHQTLNELFSLLMTALKGDYSSAKFTGRVIDEVMRFKKENNL